MRSGVSTRIAHALPSPGLRVCGLCSHGPHSSHYLQRAQVCVAFVSVPAKGIEASPKGDSSQWFNSSQWLSGTQHLMAAGTSSQAALLRWHILIFIPVYLSL